MLQHCRSLSMNRSEGQGEDVGIAGPERQNVGACGSMTSGAAKRDGK